MKPSLLLSLVTVSVLTLSACESLNIFGDDDEKRLEGERMSLYDFEKTLQKDPNTQFGLDGTEGTTDVLLNLDMDSVSSAMVLDATWTNKFWPQAGGYPNHAMKNLALNMETTPRQSWSSSIGAGGTKRMPLTADPIIADGKVFTLNNDAEIIAFDADTGQKLWETEIIKQGEDEVVIGGGLGFSGGMIFATNGFNEVVALNPNSGDIIWRAQTKAPVRGAPAAIPGRVVVTTMDNETIAYTASDGQKLWSHRGLSNDAGLIGATTPAIVKDALITTYSSGEVYALHIDTGLELWSENLSPIARNAGQTKISDIRALPVIDGGYVYVASYNNTMKSIDLRTGQTQWQIPLGSESTPWVSGNRIFVIDTQKGLTALDRASGQVAWQTQLTPFEDMEDRDDPISWVGPLLVNNAIMVFGSHGEAAIYNPATGEKISDFDIPSDVMLAPAIAMQTLYLISENGRLTAFE